MKALGTAHHREVEVGGVPGPIAEKPGSMSSIEGQYTLMSWRHVRVEVVGCERICEVDAASRLLHHTGVGGAVFSKNSPDSRRVDPYTSSAAQALISGLNVDRMPRRTIGRLSTQCSPSACDMRAAFSGRCRRSTI